MRLMPEHRVLQKAIHVITYIAVALTTLYVLAVLGFGYLFVTADWGTLGCFDGDEPACATGPASLSDIRASSWMLAGLAVSSVATAGAVGWRLRAWQQVAAACCCCQPPQSSRPRYGAGCSSAIAPNKSSRFLMPGFARSLTAVPLR